MVFSGLIVLGLSPHRRGTLHYSENSTCCCRFIPAQAGNTYAVTSRRRRDLVYPRTGGEHSQAIHGHTVQVRFIPAQAGNTSTSAIVESSKSVYPRTGRGTPLLRWLCGIVQRFIPAQAGNTPEPGAADNGRTVYPRTGGEHFRFFHFIDFVYGLSPHRRGTL